MARRSVRKRRHRHEVHPAYEAMALMHAEQREIDRARDDGIYRGEPDCSDCLSMTHCESHKKIEGLYPSDVQSAATPRQGDPK